MNRSDVTQRHRYSLLYLKPKGSCLGFSVEMFCFFKKDQELLFSLTVFYRRRVNEKTEAAIAEMSSQKQWTSYPRIQDSVLVAELSV